VSRYSGGNLLDTAVDFLTSATWWALHKESGVNRDATRLRVEAPKARSLVDGSVLSRLARYHATERIEIVAAELLGHVQRSVFTEAGIERATHANCIGLQTIRDCNLRSLDLENALNTISSRSFLPELYLNPALHPSIPLVEMIHSWDFTVSYFDPNDASLLYGTV
jgi:hypothetical protein